MRIAGRFCWTQLHHVKGTVYVWWRMCIIGFPQKDWCQGTQSSGRFLQRSTDTRVAAGSLSMPVSFVDRQMSNDHRAIDVLQRSARDLDSIILRPTNMAPIMLVPRNALPETEKFRVNALFVQFYGGVSRNEAAQCTLGEWMRHDWFSMSWSFITRCFRQTSRYCTWLDPLSVWYLHILIFIRVCNLHRQQSRQFMCLWKHKSVTYSLSPCRVRWWACLVIGGSLRTWSLASRRGGWWCHPLWFEGFPKKFGGTFVLDKGRLDMNKVLPKYGL